MLDGISRSQFDALATRPKMIQTDINMIALKQMGMYYSIL